MKQKSKQKIAILYAESLYDVAEQSGNIEDVLQNVKDFGKILGEKIDELSYLSSPIIPSDEKNSMIVAVCKKIKTSAEFENMLKLLAENGHFGSLGDVIKIFTNIYNEKHNIAEVEVETVVPLTAQQNDSLEQKLTKIFQKNVAINYIINPDILGGLVIKSGTLLIDNSIRNKLECLEQAMKGNQ